MSTRSNGGAREEITLGGLDDRISFGMISIYRDQVEPQRRDRKGERERFMGLLMDFPLWSTGKGSRAL